MRRLSSSSSWTPELQEHLEVLEELLRRESASAYFEMANLPAVSLVHLRAKADALRQLCDLPSRRTVLAWLETNWEHRVCQGRAEAVEGLNGILQVCEAKTRTPSFLSRAIDTERMSAQNPFAQIVRFWSNHQTSLDQERIDKVLRGPLQGRYLVVAPAPERATLIIQHWGDRLGSYDPPWA